jgi:hypothetical protein
MEFGYSAQHTQQQAVTELTRRYEKSRRREQDLKDQIAALKAQHELDVSHAAHQLKLLQQQQQRQMSTAAAAAASAPTTTKAEPPQAPVAAGAGAEGERP